MDKTCFKNKNKKITYASNINTFKIHAPHKVKSWTCRCNVKIKSTWLSDWEDFDNCRWVSDMKPSEWVTHKHSPEQTTLAGWFARRSGSTRGLLLQSQALNLRLLRWVTDNLNHIPFINIKVVLISLYYKIDVCLCMSTGLLDQLLSNTVPLHQFTSCVEL